MGTLIVGALVDGAVSFLFPKVQCRVTVRAPIAGLGGAVAALDRGAASTDFAEQLAAAPTIVEVQIVGWGGTVQTTTALGNFPATAMLNLG